VISHTFHKAVGRIEGALTAYGADPETIDAITNILETEVEEMQDVIDMLNERLSAKPSDEDLQLIAAYISPKQTPVDYDYTAFSEARDRICAAYLPTTVIVPADQGEE